MRMRAVLLVALAAVIPLVAEGAPLISPAAGTDVVLSLRKAPAGELRLDYRKDSGNDPGVISVGIASDYHYVRSANQLRIHDYKLHRIFLVQGGQTFVNDSLFAEVWYRAMELRNRITIARAIKGAGIESSKEAAVVHDPFFMETELGVVSPDVPRPELQQVTDNGRISWQFNSEEVAAVRYEKTEVPAELQASLRRFWPTFCQIHPDIAAALASSNRMPAELWVKERPFAKDAVIAHWILLQSRLEAAALYPLPAHLPARPTVTAGAYPEIFATLAAASAEKRKPLPQEAYVSKARAAIDKGAGLEALLWVIEMDLARGKPAGRCEPNDTSSYCSLSVQAGPLARGDARTAIAFTTHSPAQLDRPQFAPLPNAYLLRLLWATRRPGKDVTTAENERDLLAALRASPIANFCKDAGDFYAMQWQPFAAWQVWDFGRLMAGHTAGDLLDTIDTVESDLVKSEHDLF
jgi:hypothetical protein